MEYFVYIRNISLKETFNCGQCFRFKRLSFNNNNIDDSNNNGTIYGGIAGNKSITLRQEEDGVTLIDANESDIEFWERFLCKDEDYPAIIDRFSGDNTLKLACEFAPGIRILKQDPFETLISFIISQNNNITRISGIIDRMCNTFADGSFPSPFVLSSLNESDLREIGAGYRARYILDAAKKVNTGEIKLDEIQKMPYNKAKEVLLRITGVGDKVADCVLLYGFHFLEAFPKDVWIKRAVNEHYKENGLPPCTKGYEGVAQQFLFNYIRNSRERT